MKIRLVGWSLGLAMLSIASARAEDIAQVFERSQRTRLAAMPVAAAEAPGVQALRASFVRLQRELPRVAGARTPQLRIVGAGALAETLDRDVVVIHAAIGELPEIARLFLLAHEMGHVMLAHWDQRIALYKRYIPGEVVQAQTDAVAPMLGREASQQSREQEGEADAFAMNALLDLGFDDDALIEMFKQLGNHAATATHPSTAQRIMHLRMIDQERQQAQLGEAAPV